MMLLVSKAMAKRSDDVKGSREAEPAQASGNEGGLGDLIEKFRKGGVEDLIKSWIGTGANKPIAPNQLQHALGPDTVASLERETGMPRDDLLVQLSRLLPEVVDKLTPDGKLPKESDLLPGPAEAVGASLGFKFGSSVEERRCGNSYPCLPLRHCSQSAPPRHRKHPPSRGVLAAADEKSCMAKRERRSAQCPDRILTRKSPRTCAAPSRTPARTKKPCRRHGRQRQIALVIGNHPEIALRPPRCWQNAGTAPSAPVEDQRREAAERVLNL